MTKVNFYHLTTSPLGKALPKLLERAVAGDMPVVVKAESEAQVEQLNRELWTYTTKVFLPHGSKADGFEEEQPIYLTAVDENPNKAVILTLIGSSDADNINDFQRCFYMFDGNNETEVKNARSRWKKYKDAGFELTYWKQNNKGGWEQGNT